MKEHKVPDCIHPDQHGCYTCEHNEVPGTYDGGCKLYIERLRRESVWQTNGINTPITDQ